MSTKTLAVFLFIACATTVSAADPVLETIDEAPPEEVSAAVRESLGSQGFRILSGERVLMELWLRSEIPVKEQTGSGGLGVSFGNLQPGTLIGVVHFPEEWADYKNNPIGAGVYMLRYAVQPADGNHVGVSQYRDFLLLLQAATDVEVETSLGPDELVVQSYASTGKPHPGMMALFPLYEDAPEPKLMRNEMDQWTLAFGSGALQMGLVVEGHGELEGY